MVRRNGRSKPRSSRRERDGGQALVASGDLLHGLGQRIRPHTYVRTQKFPIGKVALDNGYAYQMFLAGLPAYTEFTTLYDMYRILRVSVKVVLDTPNLSTAYPRITSVVDYDDQNAPTDENELLQYQNAKNHQFSQSNVVHSFEFVPRTAGAVFQGVTTAYSVGKAGQWIDTAYPSTSHYGFKFFIVNYNSTATPNSQLSCYVTYQFQCKNAR